jgi:hypothetical protein
MEGYFQEPISGPPNPIRVNNLRSVTILLAQEY